MLIGSLSVVVPGLVPALDSNSELVDGSAGPNELVPVVVVEPPPTAVDAPGFVAVSPTAPLPDPDTILP